MKTMLVVLVLMFASVAVLAEEPPEYITQWGEYGSGNGQFDRPKGIAVDSYSNIYVTDTQNYRIQKFTSDGVYIMQWGEYGNAPGYFREPRDIALDSNNNVYVIDQLQRIQKFTSEGVFLTQWGNYGDGDGQFHDTKGIAVDSNDNVYVTDGNYPGGNENNFRVQKFTSDGVYIMQWGEYGHNPGQFLGISGIATDSSNNVFVVAGPTRVQKFTSDGAHLIRWGSPGTGEGEFNGIVSIAVDTDDDVYVGENSTQNIGCRIQKFDNVGVYLTQWGEWGSGNGQFDPPSGITFDISNNIYVTDFGNYRIQKFGYPFTGVEELPSFAFNLNVYPNPFNPSTTIHYTVTETSLVTLEVFDLEGRLIDRLVSGVNHKPNEYSITYSPSLVSGVYFVKLQVANKATTMKIVLLK
jgi:hypothetical protein